MLTSPLFQSENHTKMARHWTEILDWVAPKKGKNVPIRDSLAVSLLATVTPLVMYSKKPDSPISSAVSAHYKACLGFCQVLFFLLWNEPYPEQTRLADFGNQVEFFHWLDSEKWLIGSHQACSGPWAMIEELFSRFCRARLSQEDRALVECLRNDRASVHSHLEQSPPSRQSSPSHVSPKSGSLALPAPPQSLTRAQGGRTAYPIGRTT